MSKELDQVIGEIEVELDGRVETNTSQETNLGQYTQKTKLSTKAFYLLDPTYK